MKADKNTAGILSYKLNLKTVEYLQMRIYKENFQEIKESYILKKVYNFNIKINLAKVNDLLTLCIKLISPQYHSFYENSVKNNDQADHVDQFDKSQNDEEKLINEC